MQIREFIKKFDWLIAAIWACLLFIPFLGSVHLFDWDEINFAESAREMLLTGNYQKVQINFVPFMEKPPLFFWLQVLSMKIFGVNEFAARFPNALVGIATLSLVFQIGKKIYGRSLAFFWVLLITGSITPHLYFKTGIIDPLYNLFIFCSIYQFFLFTGTENKTKHTWLMGLFMGLAIITKGPVAVIIVLLSFIVYWALNRFKLFFSWKDILRVFVSSLLVSIIWFGYETLQNGPSFLVEFFKYQVDLFVNPVAGHGQPFYYHPIVLLLGAFPSSIIALKMLFNRRKSNEGTEHARFLGMMQIMFWVVLILFSVVTTKIVHYSSLCYIPLTFMAAYQIIILFEKAEPFTIWQTGLIGLIGFLLAMIFMVIPFIDSFKIDLLPAINDEFAKGNLSLDGGWKGYEAYPGVLLLITVLMAIAQLFKHETLKGSFLLLLFMSFFIPIVLKVIAPRIETYSQNSAIEFYKSIEDQDCYVETVGFKSYAQYFYKKVQPWHANSEDESWLMSGKIDKPAYFVLKEGNLENHVNAEMKELYRKGGFVFFKREVPQ